MRNAAANPGLSEGQGRPGDEQGSHLADPFTPDFSGAVEPGNRARGRVVNQVDRVLAVADICDRGFRRVMRQVRVGDTQQLVPLARRFGRQLGHLPRGYKKFFGRPVILVAGQEYIGHQVIFSVPFSDQAGNLLDPVVP